MERRTIPLLCAILLALLLAGTAEAHANLVRSEPPAGALLQAAPKELVLEFSEELDPSFSRAQLVNSKNQVVNAGPGAIDSANPRIMRLALQDLPKDSYTAIWRARSAVDGHITQGSVPFGVGVAATTTSLIPAPGAPDPATATPPPLDAGLRWLNLLMAAVALGGLPFGLLVWRPALHAATTDDGRRTTDDQQPAIPSDVGRWSLVVGREAADAAMTRAIRRLILIGGVLFLFTNALFLLNQAATADEVPFAQALGAPVLQLLQGRSGILWIARVVLTLATIAIAWRLPPVGQGEERPWWIALAIGGAVLLTFSLNSHSAAIHQGAVGHQTHIPILLDWAHISAMVIWLGGLIPLAVAIRTARRAPERTLPLAMLIPQFSRVAIASVVTLTLTGLYSYVQQINGLDLLAATTYGRALLIKSGLFGVLFLLGALNLLILSPRLQTSGNHLRRAFGRSVRIELVLGAVLLLAVGAMTSVAPSKTAWEAHEQLGLMQEAKVGAVDLVLRVAPAQIGDNEFAVDVLDKRPGAQSAPSKVLLRFNMVGMDMGVLQTDTQTTDKQRYTARGSFTSMGGRWNVEVVLRRAGFDDVRHTFELDIVRSAAVGQ